ncbi:hypothetical protein ACFQRC_04920 [Enterovirga sp. GCM10030262]|uniref:hypothetical protein n=1 Tax=Enterovirga sp. GCM10030262 TaxID=3273391 RepID=UPI00360BD3FF
MVESLEGAQEVTAWFGFFPSFHDATITFMGFSRGDGIIEIEAFRMTDEIDDKGYFVLDRHAKVTVHLLGVSGTVMSCHSNPTILELGIRKVLPEHHPPSDTAAIAGDFEIGFDDVCGGGGSIYARDIRFSVSPKLA